MLIHAHSHLQFSSPPPKLSSLISTCKTLQHANQLHAHLITTGLVSSAGVLLSLLSSPRRPLRLLARRIFFSSDLGRRPSLWNPIIKSFSHGPHPDDPLRAVLAFSLMLYNEVPADGFSFSLTLKACARASSLREASQIHSLVHKSQLASNLYLQNSLVAVYSRCGQLEVARQVFDRIPERDSVSWNSMIDGYVKSGRLGAARNLFDGMREDERNLVTWNTMVCGYAALGHDGIDVAKEIFDLMPERDSVSWNLMIDGYAKCHRMEEAVGLFEAMPQKDMISWANLIAGYMEVAKVGSALTLFDEMPEKDVVVWNIMLAGYVKNGRFAETLHLFNQMRTAGNVVPDVTTLATTLSAISELGRVKDGIAIHKYIKRNRLPLNGKLGVGLIDMYSKCGRLEDALHVFETSRTSIDHWNAMIGGLAVHGYGELALKLFREMGKHPMKPDDITFIGVLNACSHSGLVKEGLMCFESMREDYVLEPKMQHYGCMVDMLGRAGRLEEAWELIKEMPFEPNDIIWRSLLSSCRKHGNFLMGLEVAKILTEGNSCDSSSYVLLSNIYAGVGMWGDARNVRMMMRERDLIKIPGCSWLELDGVKYEFVVGDNSHSRTKEAYSLLKEISTIELYNSHDLYSIQQN